MAYNAIVALVLAFMFYKFTGNWNVAIVQIFNVGTL